MSLPRLAGSIASILALFLLGLYNLGGPGAWWDEGWTMSVARTWVERGLYGRLLDGQPVPPGLEAAFPTTALVALSFRLFGVGLWQARLPVVLCMVAALALMYYLARRLYNRRVALGTIFAALLMPIHAQLHPLIMGRQVLAELPMLAYLLAGYACLLLAFRRPIWLLPAAMFWGIALITKAQILPFWIIALAAPLLATLWMRRWRDAGVVLGAAVGGLAVMQTLLWLWQQFLAEHSLPAHPISGLLSVIALVPDLYNRLFALSNIALFGIPAVIGIAYAAWRMLGARNQWLDNSGAEIVRLSLLVLCGSWLAWYLLLSVGLPRYLLPVTFLSSIFVSAWLFDLTDQFEVELSLRRISLALRGLRFDRRAVSALLAVVVLMATVPLTLQTLYSDYLNGNDHTTEQLADFFNTQTPSNTRIETYETELHFLLNRSYHYPPDQIHVELNRRSMLNQTVDIHYNPLEADPDYLVVGGFARWNKLYQPVIDTGAFRLIRRVGFYDLYQRVR